MKITATDLACERGGRIVFTDLNFAVESGKFLRLTGPNGAGKSSLLRLISGLSEPSQGSLKLAGGGDSDLTLAEQAHYIAHGEASKSALSVAENLVFWRDFLGGGDLANALGAVNLASLADYPVALLSEGQKRRLALARLALANRPIWLLDEPSVGLDEASQKLLLGLMRQHLKTNGIIIAATHVPLGLKPDQNLHLSGASQS